MPAGSSVGLILRPLGSRPQSRGRATPGRIGVRARPRGYRRLGSRASPPHGDVGDRERPIGGRGASSCRRAPLSGRSSARCLQPDPSSSAARPSVGKVPRSSVSSRLRSRCSSSSLAASRPVPRRSCAIPMSARRARRRELGAEDHRLGGAVAGGGEDCADPLEVAKGASRRTGPGRRAPPESRGAREGPRGGSSWSPRAPPRVKRPGPGSATSRAHRGTAR